MNHILSKSVVGAFAFAFAFGASATDWFVNGKTGTDSGTGPFKTIGYAVGQAKDNDTIYVAAGTYGVTASIIVSNAVRIVGQGAKPTDVFVDRTKNNFKIFDVTNQGAVLENLTASKGGLGGSAGNGFCFNLQAGVLTNCVACNTVKRNYDSRGAAVYVAAGALAVDCVVSNCYSYETRPAGMSLSGTALRCKILDNWARQSAAGVQIDGSGRLIDCVVLGNKATAFAPGVSHGGWGANGGGGVYVNSANAVVSNCVISGNSVLYTASNYSAEKLRGGGIYCAAAGKIYNTVISGNFAYNDGGGIYGKGYLYNCVITDNVTSNATGGAICGGAELYNCTVAGNRTLLADKIGGITGAAKLTNSILWDNYTAVPGETPVLSNYDSATFTDCYTMPATTGATETDPLFRDAANGDYRLSHTSPAINQIATMPTYLPAIDARGFPRFFAGALDLGGFEDGNEFTIQIEPSSVAAPATPSVGLHENFEVGAEVACSVTTPYPGAGAPTNSVCTGYRYATRTSESATPVVTEGNESTVTVTAARFADLTWFCSTSYKTTVVSQNPEKGTVSMSEAYHPQGTVFTVTATPAAGYKFMYWFGDVPEADRTKATITLTADRARNLTAAFGGVWYVDGTNGNDDNAGTASAPFKTIHRAVTNAVDYDEVRIAPGTYSLDKTINVTNALHLIGTGAKPSDVTVQNCEKSPWSNLRVMVVTDPGAVVENMRVRYGCDATGNGNGKCVDLKAGVLRKCIVSESTSHSQKAGAALSVAAGARAEDCIIADNECYENSSNLPAGMYLAGTAIRCRIEGNKARQKGAGVWIEGSGRLLDSVVSNNYSQVNGVAATAGFVSEGGAGIWVNSANAVVSNCVVSGNIVYYPAGGKYSESSSRGGGIYCNAAGTVYNTKIVGNFAHNDGGGVYCAAAAKFYNCLIADNVTSNATGGAVCGAATLVNCTVVSNLSQEASCVGGVSGSAKITNSIVYDNYTVEPGKTPVLSNYNYTLATIDHSLTSPLPDTGEGNKTGDPMFRNVAKGRYQVLRESPAATGSVWKDVLTGLRRLDGTPMVDAKGRMPMGCCACYDAPGFMLMLK